MSKQFTKVTKTYSNKNKLQLAILRELEQIDAFLFSNKNEAQNHIKQLYENALRSYKGNAAVPRLTNFEPNNDTIVFFVDDVIFISIYTVKTDLS